MMQAADVLVLVAVAAHTAVHTPILSYPMPVPILDDKHRLSDG